MCGGPSRGRDQEHAAGLWHSVGSQDVVHRRAIASEKLLMCHKSSNSLLTLYMQLHGSSSGSALYMLWLNTLVNQSSQPPSHGQKSRNENEDQASNSHWFADHSASLSSPQVDATELWATYGTKDGPFPDHAPHICDLAIPNSKLRCR